MKLLAMINVIHQLSQVRMRKKYQYIKCTYDLNIINHPFFTIALFNIIFV
jgi:hypothetical protein